MSEGRTMTDRELLALMAAAIYPSVASSPFASPRPANWSEQPIEDAVSIARRLLARIDAGRPDAIETGPKAPKDPGR